MSSVDNIRHGSHAVARDVFQLAPTQKKLLLGDVTEFLSPSIHAVYAVNCGHDAVEYDECDAWYNNNNNNGKNGSCLTWLATS